MVSEKLYIVKHVYDVDGGFGDAIYSDTVVGVVKCTEEEIEKFVEDFDKPEVYDMPYADLICHSIEIEAISPITIDELRKNPYGDNGWYARQVEYFKKMYPDYETEVETDTEDGEE